MRHVLVEGGPTTARGFLSERLVDRAIIVRAPVEFARPVPSNIDNETLKRYDETLEIIGNYRVVCRLQSEVFSRVQKRPVFLSFNLGGVSAQLSCAIVEYAGDFLPLRLC